MNRLTYIRVNDGHRRGRLRDVLPVALPRRFVRAPDFKHNTFAYKACLKSFEHSFEVSDVLQIFRVTFE